MAIPAILPKPKNVFPTRFRRYVRTRARLPRRDHLYIRSARACGVTVPRPSPSSAYLRATVYILASNHTSHFSSPHALPPIPPPLLCAQPPCCPRSRSAEDDDLADEPEEEDTRRAAPTVAFKLLSRGPRGRIETRQLLVPEEAPMAVKLAKAVRRALLILIRALFLAPVLAPFPSKPCL